MLSGGKKAVDNTGSRICAAGGSRPANKQAPRIATTSPSDSVMGSAATAVSSFSNSFVEPSRKVLSVSSTGIKVSTAHESNGQWCPADANACALHACEAPSFAKMANPLSTGTRSDTFATMATSRDTSRCSASFPGLSGGKPANVSNAVSQIPMHSSSDKPGREPTAVKIAVNAFAANAGGTTLSKITTSSATSLSSARSATPTRPSCPPIRTSDAMRTIFMCVSLHRPLKPLYWKIRSRADAMNWTDTACSSPAHVFKNN
mmetsp:Transcript_56865/g.124751  ORF Transcript_56865/g.124751 Transcript_56865/m.124751 type:complete len:261 (-) Transcript_56865:722-1504(-)